MELKNYFAQDAEGNAQPYASCYLYSADTSNLINGLVDAANQPLTNPFVSDSYGLIQFKAPNGIYDLRVISGNRDYKIRVQAADVTELIDGIDAAVAAADTATTAADLAETNAAVADSAAVNATNARDDAESYAVDVLTSVTEVNNNRILAQQAVLDAGNAAETKVAALRGSPPVSLDTLEKLANAINNDSNFANTIDSFIQDGVGAVMRTRLEKSKDILSVKDYGVTGVGDETAKLQAIVNYASTAKKRIVIDIPMTITDITVIGHVDIETVGDGRVKCTGTARGGVIAKNNWSLLTNFTSVGTEVYPASTGTENSYITVDSASGIQIYDTLYIKDNVTNAYSTTSSRIAEIANVVAIIGTKVYLDCRLRRSMSSGSVYILPKTHCRIVGEFYGDRSIVRGSVIYIEGYVAPIINIKVNGNSSRALFLMSCLYGQYNVTANDLDDKASENRLGYAVVAYGACKGGLVNVYASNVRHAYTDGVYSSVDIESGNVLDYTVNGICNSPTAAGFDTHPDSDGTVFGDIQVWSAHNDLLQPSRSLNFAVQLRGSNHTIKSLRTDLDKGIAVIPTKIVNSVDKFYNIDHRDKLIGAVSGTNRFQSIVFFAAAVVDNPIGQTGTHLTKVYSSDLGVIQYETGGVQDEYYTCSFNWSKTTSGWPSSPSVGGIHKYFQCTIKEPTSMNLGGNDEYYLNGTTVFPGAARSFGLGIGANLTAINSGIDAVGFSVPNSAFAYSTIASGTASFKYHSVWINDDRIEGATMAFNNITSGSGVITTKDLASNTEISGFAVRGNGDVTLTVGLAQPTQRFTASLTADRTVTLSTINAKSGSTFIITRPATGAFNLIVGSVKTLSSGQWCVVQFDGTVWQLVAYGSL